MRLSAHQPIYLGGYLGHFAKLAWCNEWIVFDACPMEDSGFENRNRIRTGAVAQWLTVPVLRSRGVPLREVRIAPGHNWQRKHWRTLELAYAKAEYWPRYRDELRELYVQPWEKLVDLDAAMFLYFARTLGIERPMRRASTMDLVGSKSALVLDMCIKAGAERYMFGPQGEGYADVAAFRSAGIEPVFQKFVHPEYQQVGKGTIPNLSVVDALLNVGAEETRRMILGAVPEV